MKTLFRSLAVLLIAAAVSTAPAQVNVTTQRYDNARTSQNLSETVLTTSNVNATTFGVLFRSAVDDQIYGQPLYVSSATMGSGPNLVFVTTVNNSVYAFNADTGAQVWMRSLGTAPTVTDLNLGGACTDMSAKCGIVGTPVVDPVTKKLYVVAKSTNTLPNTQHTIYSLDLATGNTLNSTVIAATQGGNTFQSRWQQNRPALLLANNVVYVAFASHCDRPYNNSYQAWLLGYRKTDLVQASVTNLTPGQQGGIWQAGTGPAADASGNVYVMTGNGNRNGTTTFAESFVKLTPDVNGALSIANPTTDTFTPNDYAAMNTADEDLGAAGPLLIPGTNLITGGGKTGELWLLNRTNLGFIGGAGDPNAVQRFKAIVQNGSATDHIHGGPVYWNSPTHGPLIYIWGESDFGRAYKLVSGVFQTPAFMTTTMRSPSTGTGMPGNMMTVSSNGSTAGTGLLWSNSNIDGNANNQTRPGALRVFNAETLAELWNSEITATPSNDSNYLAKYNYPTVANGKVYHATFGTATSGTGELVVYGLKNTNQVAAPTFSPAAGTYATTQSVTISTATSAATIRYTTNGVDPTSTTGTVYSAPVSVSASTTLKAIAYKSAMTDSTVSTANYIIGSVTVIEGESLSVAASSGDVWRTVADGSASGGSIAFYDATAAADYVSLTVNVPAAGTYNVKIRYKSGANRGIFQLATATTVGGTYTNIGSAQDEYNAAQLYNQLADCGNATFAASGNHIFRFTITGKNAASSGFGIAIDSIELTGSGGGGGTVAAPTFSPAAGTYSTTQSVTISSATSGSTIRYTTNGVDPTSSSGTVYSAAVSIAATTTLKAIAYKSGMTDSSVTTGVYTISAGGGTTYQAESLTVAAISASDTSSNISEGGLSGGQGKSFAANAATDFITFTVPSVAAGTFNVFIGVKKSSTEGIFQLATASSTGGTYFDKGSPQDLYSASATYTEVSIGAVVFGSAGDKAFRFTVSGKNATSTDYDLVIDYIRIAP
ncbi:chitobiase/beta-hexosaminidase C-terminal domain-containing protein [Oleiharenicola lentus]|uniref:chitobiase/beta-hexosaminidase C-terminal domain-containing protein n=1 Tax=Oleiharenicola lentus TaxID=2508720 RepID=UPI003F675435